jgi:hypothetical protein
MLSPMGVGEGHPARIDDATGWTVPLTIDGVHLKDVVMVHPLGATGHTRAGFKRLVHKGIVAHSSHGVKLARREPVLVRQCPVL